MHWRNTVSLKTVSVLVLGVAVVLKAINGSTSTSSNSSFSANSVAFPNCTGYTSYIADGDCDGSNNNMECGYDGGDCCECSCFDTASYTCGKSGFYCLDPVIGYPEPGCDVVPTACVEGTRQNLIVETTADADSLANTIYCSGGDFVVEWKGYVSVNRTFYVVRGTMLEVIGASDAVADGGGATQLFAVMNATLLVIRVKLSNGDSTYGGAISAALQSQVVLASVSLASNTADGFGGAIHLDSSYLYLADNSNFTGNSALHGGAIYMDKGSLLVPFVGSGERYRFSDNIAKNGGALYVSDESTVVEYHRTSSTSSSSNTSSSPGSSYSTGSSYRSATNQYTSGFDYPGESYSAVGANVAYTIFSNNTVESLGGAIYMKRNSKMSWNGRLEFEGNSARDGGAVFAEFSNAIRWQGLTLFVHNSARNNGGAVSVSDSTYTTVTISGDVRFLNNTCGGSGGALAFYGYVDTYWEDIAPVFYRNSAALSGGAIYFAEGSGLNQISHARFMENTAKNGGAVFTYKSEINFYSCAFVENSALEAGGAIEIILGDAVVNNTAFVGNFASEGGALKLFGSVELLNSSFFDNRSGEGGGSAIANVGINSRMTGLTFSANDFLCAAAKYGGATKGNTRLTTTCKGCDTLCDGCVIEDNTSVPICTTTFPHAESQYGTATIEGVLLDRGYWRASNRSTNALSCYNADACLGGLTGHPGYCSEGYEGPYCSVCSEGYAKMLASTCSKCSEEKEALVGVVLAAAVLAVLAFVWHMVSIEQEGTASRVVVARVEKLLPLQSIKIIVVVWQIVTQFSSVTNVTYPEAYQRLLDVVALFNFDIGWVLSVGCFMDATFHDRLLVATIGPIVALTLVGITYKVAVERNRQSEGALCAVYRKHLGAVVLLTFFMYSSVSSAIFRTFACDELDDGTVYLRADYRIRCDSPRHKAFQMYAGFMIVVYPVGIPLFYAILLFRERKVLAQGIDNVNPREPYISTVRKPYRPSVFYYEVVECSRRILLTGVVVFIYPNTAAQIAVAILIAFTFVLVSEGLSPYASKWNTWVARAGHVIVFLSMYVALLFKVDVSNESQRDKNIFAGILVAGHATMVLLVVVEIIALVGSVRSRNARLPVSRS